MDKSLQLSTDVKKQHTVPRFLLDQFGFSSKGKRKQLYTFDKASGRLFQQSVLDASTRNTFYNIDNHPDKISLEPFLGMYETKAAPIIQKIVHQKNITSITDDEKYIVATFIAIQRARSYGELMRVNHMVTLLTEKLSDIGATPEQILRELGSTESTDRKNLFLSMIIDQGEIANSLLMKDWILYETDLANPFYISDDPVTLYNNIDMGPYSNLGYSLEGIQIHLPLSSTLTLAITCPTIAGRIVKSKKEIEKFMATAPHLLNFIKKPFEIINYGKAYLEGVPLKQSYDNVRFLNSLQVMYSEKYIFCEVNDFSLAREMINNNEKYKSGPRMSVS